MEARTLGQQTFPAFVVFCRVWLSGENHVDRMLCTWVVQLSSPIPFSLSLIPYRKLRLTLESQSLNIMDVLGNSLIFLDPVPLIVA